VVFRRAAAGSYSLTTVRCRTFFSVDATTRIRSFDINTPIISMSSTTAPSA
jgi:hypothetical protein